MRTGLIIPTRYKSERLPGKVLIDIDGKPNLERIVDRALQSQLDIVILAVSYDDSKEIDEWYRSVRMRPEYLTRLFCVYGSHNDLMERTLKAAQIYNLDVIAMVSHDCTLIDPEIINALLRKLYYYDADYASNIVPRSFPDGFDVQVHTLAVYERVEALIPRDHPTRSWTSWNIWHWREKLDPKPRIINLLAKPYCYHPEWNVCLDTPEDLVLIRAVYENFRDRIFDHEDVIEFMIANPQLRRQVKATELLQEGI